MSEPADSADQPQDNSDLPPGLSPNKQDPTESLGSPGTASASNRVPTAAAASNAVTSAADSVQNCGVSGPSTSQDTEKQLRNLRKKIRQADATAKKAAAGQHLTSEEQEKLKKLAIWYVHVFVCHYDSEVIYKS